jgi:hypothetical protein
VEDLPRVLVLIALCGAALTAAGAVGRWFLDEERRLHRALSRVLKAPPDAMVVARGRGRGAGFSFETGLAAVAWDGGAWCLVYRLGEFNGAELLIDGQSAARAVRDEPRRALDQTPSAAAQVTLRLFFDDPRHPDFDLHLYLAGDEAGHRPRTPADAVLEANRWLARADAILRRPSAPRGPAPAPVSRAAPPDPDVEGPTQATGEPPRPAPTAPRPRDDVDDDQEDLPF